MPQTGERRGKTVERVSKPISRRFGDEMWANTTGAGEDRCTPALVVPTEPHLHRHRLEEQPTLVVRLTA